MYSVSLQLVFLLLFSARSSNTLQSPASTFHESSVPRLQLTVRTDKRTYSIKGKMQIEVQLKNGASDTVYLYRWDLCWGQGPALNLWVEDSAGRGVQTEFLWDCVPPPPRPADPSEFIRIDPANFYGLSNRIKLREIVKKPGAYAITIRFGSSLSPEFLKDAGFPQRPYWTTLDKPLTQKIQIRVTP